MRRFLLLLALASLLLLATAGIARADYWPPDLPATQSVQHLTH